MENQPDTGQAGRGGVGSGFAFHQRLAQLCEVPQAEWPGGQPLPAEYVEQDLLAAVGGGDDADGAVVYLWPAA
ncbi:hypothetical protein D3C80_1825950 [compost metagenome]